MAYKDSILYDKTELVLWDRANKNKPVRLDVSYDRIVSIRFQKCTEKKLFSSKDSEKISITIAGRPNPVEFFKFSEGEDNFAKYKNQLTKFAKDNRVSFSSEI